MNTEGWLSLRSIARQMALYWWPFLLYFLIATPFVFSVGLFPHCYFLSFYKGTWLLWEISQPSSWLVDFQNKVGLFSSASPLSEALAYLADKQSDLELNHTTVLGTHVYTIKLALSHKSPADPNRFGFTSPPPFFFYHFSMHDWATVLKQLRPLGIGIATENTQAANARALGTQYGDQEAGPPRKRNWEHHKVLKSPEIWLNWAQWRSHKERKAQCHCPVSFPTQS